MSFLLVFFLKSAPPPTPLPPELPSRPLRCVPQFRDRDLHEQTACPNRSVPCALHCGQWVRAVDAKAHAANDCPLRVVPCRVGCGRVGLLCRARDTHEQDECVRPCAWEGCPQRVGPAAVRRVHETFLCPRRPVACPLGCGAVGLCAALLELHTATLCPRRLRACPLGCGATLLARHLEGHCGIGERAGALPSRSAFFPL